MRNKLQKKVVIDFMIFNFSSIDFIDCNKKCKENFSFLPKKSTIKIEKENQKCRPDVL